MKQRRQVWGYLDFGDVRIPPLPEQIVMTDRDDGTLYALSHNISSFTSEDGLGYISINTSYNTKNDITQYAAYEGPIMLVGNPPNTLVRLLIRGAHLGYEIETFNQQRGEVHQMKPRTRNGVTRIAREINVPTTWATPPDNLGWTTIANLS